MAALVAEVVLAASVDPDNHGLIAVESPAMVDRANAAAVAGQTAPVIPRITVTATVTAGDVPIAGAQVSIGDGSGPVSRSAVTGADGVVVFGDLEPGVYQLWATRGDQVSPVSRASAGGDAEVALALGPGAPVDGRAVAAAPLGARARAVFIPVGLDHAVFFADIDRDGRFAVDALPRGRWRLRLEVPDHVAAREVLFDAGEEPVALEVKLRPTGQVAGLVLDRRGAPVAGATLVLRRRDGGRVGRGGADWALSPAGIRWIHPLAVERHLPIRDARRFGARRPGSRPPECGAGHCGVDIGVEHGSVVHAAAPGRIAAVVHDPNRLAGRFVAIEHDFGLKSFYMHLDEIRIDLEVGKRVTGGEPIGTLGSTGIVRSKPHLHFSVSQEIDGRPWFLDPEPMLHHAMVLPEPGSLTAPATTLAGRSLKTGAAPRGLEPMTTGADGRFRIDQLPAGSYIATAYHSRLAPGTSAPFAITSGETTGGVVVELADGVVLFGEVQAGGLPIEGAKILAEEGSGESRRIVARATTDAFGRYELRPLDGELTVRALSRDRGQAERAVAVSSAAGGRREVSFELAVLEAELRGRVLAEGGAPVAGATVQIVEGPPAARRRLLTDTSGRFAVPATAGGRYRVRVASSEHPIAGATIVSDRDAVITLAAAGLISAEVRDAHSREPVAGVPVIARGPGGARARAVTDTRGVAELAPVAAGSWRLAIAAPGYTRQSASVRVVAGRRAEPTVELTRGAVLAGVLRDGDGVRIAGGRVRVGPASATTDGDGRFRIEDAPTGLVEIRADKGDLRGITEIELAPGDELVTLELRIE